MAIRPSAIDGVMFETSNKEVQIEIYEGNTKILTNDDLEEEKFSWSTWLGSNAFKLGMCATREVQFTIRTTLPSLKGKTIDIYATSLNRDIQPPSTNIGRIHFGKFVVTEDKAQDIKNQRIIKAKDRMETILNTRMDEWLDDQDFSVSLGDFATNFLRQFNITRSNIYTLSNSSMEIYRTSFYAKYVNGATSGLYASDIIEAICEMTGTFAQLGTVDTDGEVFLFTPLRGLGDMTLYRTPSQYRKFRVETEENSRIERVRLLSWGGIWYEYLGLVTFPLRTYYTIENNAITPTGSGSERTDMDTIGENILDEIMNVPTRVFELEGLANPCLLLGDKVVVYDNDNNVVCESIATRITHTGINAMMTTVACDLEEYYSPDRMTRAEDNIIMLNNKANAIDGRVTATNTNLANNYSNTNQMNNAIGNAVSGYLPLSGGTMSGNLVRRGLGGETTVLNSDSLNAFNSSNQYSTLHLQYGGGVVKIGAGTDTDTTALEVKGEAVMHNGMTVEGGDTYVESLEATVIWEGGTSLADKYAPKSHGHADGLSFNNNVGISGIMGGGTDGWGIQGSGADDNGRLKIWVSDNYDSDWLDFEFRDWSGATATPLQLTGNQIVANATIFGDIPHHGLLIQSRDTVRDIGWSEGVYVLNHSSGYSVVAMGDSNHNNVLGLVQNSASKLHYIDVKENGTTKSIKIPFDSGTLALTKNIPTTLPANGGNADTVDGLHASDFASNVYYPQYTPQYSYLYQSHADLLTTNGFYYCSGANNGLPSGVDDANVLVMSHDDVWIHELCFKFGGNGGDGITHEGGVLYTRIKNGTKGGVWLPWHLIYTDKIMISGTCTANSTTNKTVTFPTAFNAVPKVIAQYSTTGANIEGNRGSIKIHNVTASGFQIVIGGSADATDRAISWIAIL